MNNYTRLYIRYQSRVIGWWATSEKHYHVSDIKNWNEFLMWAQLVEKGNGITNENGYIISHRDILNWSERILVIVLPENVTLNEFIEDHLILE